MRILNVSPYLPWPLNTGGNAGLFSTLKCMEEDHEFTLVCPVYTDEAAAAAKELQAQLPRVKVRAVYFGEPQPKFLIRVAKTVVRAGRRMLLYTPHPDETIPPEAPDYPFKPLPRKLIMAVKDELMKGVDLFQAEFADMLPLGAWLPKELPKVFVHHQIHFVYAQRFAETHAGDSYAGYLAAIMRPLEHAYLQDFDAVITMSEPDREALLPYVAPDKVFTSPSPIPADVKIAQQVPPGFDGRFLFVASEEHGPNRDALEWLLAKMWPDIHKQLPESKLLVVGKWSEAAKSRFAAPGVVFTGFVTDLAATLRGGIMLVPLRIGSGIRVKILVALALGVPVVSTSVGSEGMPLNDGEDILLRDKESDFVTAAVELSRNPKLWRRLAESGKAAVSRHYSPEVLRQKRNEIYASLARASETRSQKLHV